jgi:parallel beta-helix repeat protein
MLGMRKKLTWIVTGIMFMTLLTVMFTTGVNAEEESTEETSSSIIYIKSDGSIDPSSAPIRVCGMKYYITADITGAIYVERSNIVIFGCDKTLTAPENDDEDDYGVYIKDQSSVYLYDLTITGFDTYAVYIYDSDNCGIIGNYIHDNYVGIRIEDSNENRVFFNDIYSNSYKGFYLVKADYNIIVGNDVSTTTWCIYLGPYSNDNEIYYNNFQKYTRFRDRSTNTWDDGNGKGNYWDTYKGSDDGSNGRTSGDGVGDTSIPHLGEDNYPLMAPWNNDDPLNIYPILKDSIKDIGLNSRHQRRVLCSIHRSNKYFNKYLEYEEKDYHRYANWMKYYSKCKLVSAAFHLSRLYCKDKISFDDWAFNYLLLQYTKDKICEY